MVPIATAAPSPAEAAGCQGRFLLECPEKKAIFADDVTWSHTSVLDLVLFETKTPLHLSNSSLARFWRFETATAAARGQLQFVLGSEITDPNFEAIAPIAKLPKPVVPPKGKLITRGLARVLSRLMVAEQQEVLDLGALDVALNRATAARYDRGRSDWVKWQMAAAARFATKTAAAISRVIPAERAASKALLNHKLLMGVGQVDLKLAQRNVRKHGLAPKVTAIMKQLGLTDGLIAQINRGFLATKPENISFSLSAQLAAPRTIAGQKAAAVQLRHFATRVPPAGKPPA